MQKVSRRNTEDCSSSSPPAAIPHQPVEVTHLLEALLRNQEGPHSGFPCNPEGSSLPQPWKVPCEERRPVLSTAPDYRPPPLCWAAPQGRFTGPTGAAPCTAAASAAPRARPQRARPAASTAPVPPMTGWCIGCWGARTIPSRQPAERKAGRTSTSRSPSRTPAAWGLPCSQLTPAKSLRRNNAPEGGRLYPLASQR